jgi:hypothetical protein
MGWTIGGRVGLSMGRSGLARVRLVSFIFILVALLISS